MRFSNLTAWVGGETMRWPKGLAGWNGRERNVSEALSKGNGPEQSERDALGSCGCFVVCD